MNFFAARQQFFPLRPNQLRFLLAEQFGDARYMISVAHRVIGELDPGRMRRAAEVLVLRHAALRTCFRRVDGEYVAVVSSRPGFFFQVIDVPDGEFATFRAAALPLALEDIDLGRADSLVRLILARAPDGQDWRVCLSIHHAISDGMSRSLAMQELFALYDGAALPPCPSYHDFATDDAAVARDEVYWRQRLADAPQDLSAPPDVEPGAQASLGVFVSGKIDLDPQGLRDQIAATGASKFGCLAAAYALGLLRLTGEPEVSFAFQSAGRTTGQVPVSVFGPFSNTLLLVARPLAFASFGALARDLTAQTRAAVQHEALPYDKLIRLVPGGVDFSLNAFPAEQLPAARGLVILPREFLDKQTEFAINLQWSQDGQTNVMRGFYDAGRLSAERTRDFLRAQQHLLQAGLLEPERAPRDLLADLSGVATTLPARWQAPLAESVIDLVIARAAAAPEATAVQTRDRTVSYADLMALSDRYAAALGRAGAVPGDRVVIVAGRSIDLVAAFLGAARAGMGLAVLDAAYPPERLRQQIDLLRPKFAFCLAATAPDWLAAVPGLEVLRPVPAGTASGPAVPGARYYLFTSGTTGTPKCVGHGFQALTFYIQWAIRRFEVQPDDCVTLLSGLNHDPVMRDIFLPLVAGARLAIPEAADFLDPQRLRAALTDSGATIMHLTPPLGRLLAMGAPDGDLATVRLCVWGGDDLPGAQVRQARRLAPAALHVNLYGTSETPQAAALYIVPPGHPATWRSTPIGRTVDWMRCDCVTPDGRICGPGELGELQVTLPHPVQMVRADGTTEAQTVHRTGDRAFVLPGGEMVFLGRRDDQVKIRGYRVELGEITAVLRTAPGVRQCLALAEPKEDGSLRLVAWCEADPEVVTVADLRHRLRRHLPDHMQPERLAVIARMPLLANGKIDRTALRALPQAAALAPRSAPPESAAERRVAALFARASGGPVNDVNLSLVDVGADSLSVIGVRLGLEELGVSLPETWAEMSIRDLAQLIRQDDLGRQTWWRPVQIESFVVIRSVAMFMIVSLHMRWFDYGGGTTHLLFLIAGLTFATYLGPQVVEQGRIGKIWTLLGKILLIGYPVMLLLFAAQIVLHRPSHPSTILFYSNFIEQGITAPKDGRLVWLWYIHCYIQVFLAIALLLGIPNCFAALRKDPFRTSLFTAIVATLGFGVLALAAGAWDVAILAHAPISMSPLLGFALVALGAALGFAQAGWSRLAVLGCAVLWAALSAIVLAASSSLLFLAGVIVLIAIPSLWLPAALARLITIVSGASFFIYLMHSPVAFVFKAAISPDLPSWTLTFGSIFTSVVLWRLCQAVVNRLTKAKTAARNALETEPG